MPKSHFERTGKLCRKIDIYAKAPGGLRYLCSTNHHKTCRAAKESIALDPSNAYAASDLVAYFAR